MNVSGWWWRCNVWDMKSYATCTYWYMLANITQKQMCWGDQKMIGWMKWIPRASFHFWWIFSWHSLILGILKYERLCMNKHYTPIQDQLWCEKSNLNTLNEIAEESRISLFSQTGINVLNRGCILMQNQFKCSGQYRQKRNGVDEPELKCNFIVPGRISSSNTSNITACCICRIVMCQNSSHALQLFVLNLILPNSPYTSSHI